MIEKLTDDQLEVLSGEDVTDLAIIGEWITADVESLRRKIDERAVEDCDWVRRMKIAQANKALLEAKSYLQDATVFLGEV